MTKKNKSGHIDPEMTARTELPDEESQNSHHDLFLEENTPMMRKMEGTGKEQLEVNETSCGRCAWVLRALACPAEISRTRRSNPMPWSHGRAGGKSLLGRRPWERSALSRRQIQLRVNNNKLSASVPHACTTDLWVELVKRRKIDLCV